MISLIYFLITFFLSLIILYIIRSSTIEGLENADCSTEEKKHNSRVYKNSGIIEQQQKNIDDFKSSIEEEITNLSKKVTGFQKSITKNDKDIKTNEIKIKAVAAKAMTAAKSKQKQMDKLSG